MLTVRETMVKTLMEERFIPALHSILKNANPREYAKWQGNCCRQTAVFSVSILRSLLPDYQWTAWDGWFDDVVHYQNVHYNHAWVYGKDADGRRLLVDLSRQHQERLFIAVKHNAYPKDHPSYIHMQEQRREPIDVEECLNDKEYYTGLVGHEVLRKVLQTIENNITPSH